MIVPALTAASSFVFVAAVSAFSSPSTVFPCALAISASVFPDSSCVWSSRLGQAEILGRRVERGRATVTGATVAEAAAVMPAAAEERNPALGRAGLHRVALLLGDLAGRDRSVDAVVAGALEGGLELPPG